MEETGPVQNDQSNASGHPKVLNASVVDEQDTETRTYVDGKTVMWQPGDIISHFYDTHSNVPYIYNGETPASNVELDYYESIDVGGSGDAVNYSRSVYPYNPETAITVEDGVDKIHVSYPTAQTYAQNSFGRGANLMIATGETSSSDEGQYFRNACGYLVIKLYGKATVKSITLSAVDGVSKIAGKATIITDENKTPVATMSDDASTSVTLDCSNNGGVALSTDQNEPTEFWFALPPVNIKGGIKIVVTDMSDNIYTKQTTKDVNITRNNVQPMAALQFVSNIPASNKIWYTKVADAQSGRITFGKEQANPFDATIIDHYYDSSVGKYVITFDRPVKTIKANAFYETAIKTIELPDGLETIEEGAFGYTQIPAITIPGSVNTIKTEAFSTCGLLKSIVFLPSPTQTPLTIACSQRSLADFGPFENASFTSIHLNRELNYVYPDGDSFVAGQLDDALFYNKYPASSDVSVTIGSQVSTIPNYMLSGLKFTSLTIPGSVTTIGNDVLTGCDKLASITFEPSPTGETLTIGAKFNGVFFPEGIFSDCPLQKISLNRQLMYANEAGTGLFSGNSLGDGITLGEQVHTLLPYMFDNSGITSLTIPETVMKIMDLAFYDCTELSSIRFEAGTEPLTIGFQPSNTNETGPFYQSPLTKIYVNRELVASKNYADKRDQNDEGIFSMSFDDAVVTVTLGENVKTISDYMFCGVKMQSLTIPGSVTTIGNDVFNGCDELTSLTFEPSPTNAALTLGYNTEDEEDGPFLDSPLTQVSLDREIIYTLEKIDLDADDEGIFSGRPLTDGVTLGNQVCTLSPYMFSNSGITSLEIPASVEEIKDYAFYNCTSLASVRFEAGTKPLTIGFQPGSDEVGPFYQSPLTSIYVNRELVASETYAAARDQWDEGIFSTSFDDAVVTVILQGNVKTISDYMFAGVQMETIWIPREVETICKGAFYYCSRLYGMTLAHTGPPTLIEDENGGAFKGTLLNNPDVQMRWIALEVGTDENIKAFKEATNWSEYADIIKAQIKN